MPHCSTCGKEETDGVWCSHEAVGDLDPQQIDDHFNCVSCYRMFQEIAEIGEQVDLEQI